MDLVCAIDKVEIRYCEREDCQVMNVTINLDPEMEKGLMARAHERGVTLDDYLHELVAREAGLAAPAQPRLIQERFRNLSDLLLHSPLAGANLDLERSKDYPGAIDFE
jgi:hypothetical protein